MLLSSRFRWRDSKIKESVLVAELTKLNYRLSDERLILLRPFFGDSEGQSDGKTERPAGGRKGGSRAGGGAGASASAR